MNEWNIHDEAEIIRNTSKIISNYIYFNLLEKKAHTHAIVVRTGFLIGLANWLTLQITITVTSLWLYFPLSQYLLATTN